jgi:hypothetical protein
MGMDMNMGMDMAKMTLPNLRRCPDGPYVYFFTVL